MWLGMSNDTFAHIVRIGFSREGSVWLELDQGGSGLVWTLVAG